MFDHDATVHDDPNAASFSPGSGFAMDDPKLNPEVFEAQLKHFVDDRGDVLWQPEDIHNIGLDRKISESGIGLLAEDGIYGWIYRQDAIAIPLHVGGNVVAGFARIGGESDHGDADHFCGGVAEHGTDSLGFVHCGLFLTCARCQAAGEGR